MFLFELCGGGNMIRGSVATADQPACSRQRLESGQILQQCLRAVRGFFMKRVQASDVDDMVQNVALRIQTHLAAERIDNPERYVFQVARSVLVDHHRKNVSRMSGQHETLEDWHHPVEELSPERILAGTDELQHVLNALQLLPVRTRQAFVLHRFEHLSYSDIALQMEISVSAVEKHIMRAIRKLSAAIDEG
ncbi:sigma-70 family RNA polymerase sigma factor [Altererythrobacter indicus]|uniref:Sigma-70 family RNA polymerase sigma factor n=1 Tax=Altericroceibacterium indicum TaxID=374177 RepID=A0A845ABR1_9SPHN|nr:RNA polymerase sigma factor [Altericroceibacterium indicum]MXP26683.1 sigma-70 family RNA polymerase sigma factor [Altericroceibacterium indicum]